MPSVILPNVVILKVTAPSQTHSDVFYMKKKPYPFGFDKSYSICMDAAAAALLPAASAASAAAVFSKDAYPNY